MSIKAAGSSGKDTQAGKRRRRRHVALHKLLGWIRGTNHATLYRRLTYRGEYRCNAGLSHLHRRKEQFHI